MIDQLISTCCRKDDLYILMTAAETGALLGGCLWPI